MPLGSPSNSDSAIVFLFVGVSDGVLLGEFSRGEFDHEALGNPGHVVTGILLGQKLFDLRAHVLRPYLQYLALVVCESLKHFRRVVAPVPDVISATGREKFHNGKFDPGSIGTVTGKGVVEKVNAPVPVRTVVGQDRISLR